jgi:hypothetical protein
MQAVYYKEQVVGSYNDDNKQIVFYNTPEGKEAKAELLKGYSVYISSGGTGCLNKDGYVIPDPYPRIIEIKQYSC